MIIVTAVKIIQKQVTTNEGTDFGREVQQADWSKDSDFDIIRGSTHDTPVNKGAIADERACTASCLNSKEYDQGHYRERITIYFNDMGDGAELVNEPMEEVITEIIMETALTSSTNYERKEEWERSNSSNNDCEKASVESQVFKQREREEAMAVFPIEKTGGDNEKDEELFQQLRAAKFAGEKGDVSQTRTYYHWW